MTKAERKSRPLRRKTSHSVIERRRREKINEGLIHLQQTVPACRQELKELLSCKASANKKNVKRDPCRVEDEVNALLEAKISSQMVLEKLCIISHTVDYVEALQAQVEAYRKLCRCSPPLPETGTLATHTHAHLPEATEEDEQQQRLHTGMTTPPQSTSEGDDEAKCASQCSGKRHWGSNNPLQLSRASSKRSNSAKGGEGQDGKKRKRAACFYHKLSCSSHGDEGSEDSSDLELDDWCDGQDRICNASQLYTDCSNSSTVPSLTSLPPVHHKRRSMLNGVPSSTLSAYHPTHGHRRSEARLGLLAQVSADVDQA